MRVPMGVILAVAMCLPSFAIADREWEKAIEDAERRTIEFLENHPSVRSDRFDFKTVTLPDGSELVLDLRLERPRNGEGPFPVIFYVHGGAWASGSKAHFGRYSFLLAEHGIAGVRMEYRLKRHGNYPEVIGDVLDSIDFIRQRAGELEIDFSRVGLAGGSAGGHLSAIAAMKTPECIVYHGFNGLYDAWDRDRSRFGGGDFTGTTEEEKKAASAIYLIREDPPDTYLYHGTEDTTVDIRQSHRFAEAIRNAGGNAAVLVYGGVGHSFFGRGRYFDRTSAALLDHASHHFGLSQEPPNPDDYLLPPRYAEVPDGFSLPGTWNPVGDTPPRVLVFRADHSAQIGGNTELGWSTSHGFHYLHWEGGTMTEIEVVDSDRIRFDWGEFVRAGSEEE